VKEDYIPLSTEFRTMWLKLKADCEKFKKTTKMDERLVAVQNQKNITK